jgi:hypothetical protein
MTSVCFCLVRTDKPVYSLWADRVANVTLANQTKGVRGDA